MKNILPMLFLLALPSAAVAQGVAKPAPPASTDATAQAKAPALPAIPAESKLKLRDLQVEYLGVNAQRAALGSRADALAEAWSALVAATFKDAGLDRDKYDLQLGDSSAEIKFVLKPQSSVVSPQPTPPAAEKKR